MTQGAGHRAEERLAARGKSAGQQGAVTGLASRTGPASLI